MINYLSYILMTFLIIMGGHKDFFYESIESQNNLNTMENKTLRVKEISFTNVQPTHTEIDSMFVSENIPFNNVDCDNWEGYKYNAQVKFRIAYSKTEIYLQYVVVEDDIKAAYDKDNGSLPYTDSCVEFFIIPADDNNIYYNLESNCIGIGTFAGGLERDNRVKFGDDVLSKIRRYSTLNEDKAFGIKTKAENNGESYQWTLTIALPVELFSLSDVKPLKGRTVRANFYKCGDDMPSPHFLSWNPIGSKSPNFHLPEYFGKIHFE